MSAISIAVKSTVESSDKLTELLWQDALRHLESTNNEVLLPINVIDMIGQYNVDKIKSRLCALIGAPVVAFVDESINALRIMRTPVFSGSMVSVATHNRISNIETGPAEASARMQGKPGLPGKSAKVPRPPNAFILYRQHHHPGVKEAYPGFSNNEISVILGKQWKAESEEVKMQFRQLAEELKKKHAEDHPDYHYTPRKPSEKKRRKSNKRNKSPPAMYTEAQMEGNTVNETLDEREMTGFDLVLGGNELPAEQFAFDSNSFDNLIQQVHEDYSKATLYPPFNLGESVEFSDFIADCF